MRTRSGLISSNWRMFLLCFFAFSALIQAPTFGETNITQEENLRDCDNWYFIVYDKTYFKGKYYCFEDGEYYASKHGLKLKGKRYSWKVKRGYIVWLYDSRGKLIEKIKGNKQAYAKSFYKFIVKKVGGDDDGVACVKDWKFRLYASNDFKGKYHCFRLGDYFSKKDFPDYYGKYISFEVRKGYEVCFYNRQGKLVKKFREKQVRYKGGFYKIVIKKVGGDNGGVACVKDWKFRLYAGKDFKGKYYCFRLGDYYVKKDFPDTYGKYVSFEVKHGYEVYFYNQKGFLLKKFKERKVSYKGGFYKIVVKKVGEHEVECVRDWKFRLYSDHSFKGKYYCFVPGEYYLKKDFPDYYGKTISFEVKKGYIVYFYNKQGKLLKKFHEKLIRYKGGFYKVVVKKGGHDGVECFEDWKFVIYEGENYKGKQVCFRKGEYFVGKHFKDYKNKRISFKVKNGYEIWLYDKRGKVLKKIKKNLKYYKDGFWKFSVRKAGYRS